MFDIYLCQVEDKRLTILRKVYLAGRVRQGIIMLQTEIWRAVNYFLTLISQTGRNVSQLQGFHFEVSGTIQLTLILFLRRKWFQNFQVSGASIELRRGCNTRKI